MGMRIHIKKLFNGLLAINIVFVIYLMMHDFEHTSTRKKRSTGNEFNSDLYEVNQPVKNLHTENTYKTSNSIKHKQSANTITNSQYKEITLDNFDILKTKNKKRESKKKKENSDNNNEEKDILEDIELLFPGYMRKIKTKIDSPGRDRIQLQYDIKEKETKKKIILLYYYDRITTDKRLKEQQCNMHECSFSRKPSDYEIADAVLFKEIPSHLKRPIKKPEQIWIFVQLESPAHTERIPEGMIVNWTATYRRDSVIPTPYEIFQPTQQLHKPNDYSDHTKIYKNYAKGKTKLVAWFVSNCMAKNNRLEYAKELQKYIQVDIYGTCGSMKCPSSDREGCMNMLKRDYKFYLAFENSNCKDYVTEKFFNALRNDVVPIVMGAHPQEYSNLAPPQSFIHVDQFTSAQKLATYLQLLDSNDHLYNSYFHWKGTGDFYDTKFMCRLCAMLEIAPKYPVWYEDVNDWWTNKACIPKNKTWRW